MVFIFYQRWFEYKIYDEKFSLVNAKNIYYTDVEYDKSSKYKIQLQQDLIAKTCIMYFEYHDTKGFGFKVSADSLKATSWWVWFTSHVFFLLKVCIKYLIAWQQKVRLWIITFMQSKCNCIQSNLNSLIITCCP